MYGGGSGFGDYNNYGDNYDSVYPTSGYAASAIASTGGFVAAASSGRGSGSFGDELDENNDDTYSSAASTPTLRTDGSQRQVAASPPAGTTSIQVQSNGANSRANQVPQWALSETGNRELRSPNDMTTFDGSPLMGNPLDLITSGNELQQQQEHQQAPQAPDESRTNGRNVLLTQATRRFFNPAPGLQQPDLGQDSTPKVPTSTTTAAPDYVMINPTSPSAAA